MTTPRPAAELRTPADHTALLINDTNADLGRITNLPDGAHRDLDGPTALGVLNVRAQLAIASGLLAVADALANREESPR